MEVFDWKSVEAEEVPEAKQATVRWLIDDSKGAPNFAMRLFEVKPGGESPAHSHWYEQEMFVLAGEGLLRGEEDFDLKAGKTIYIPPYEEHQILNNSDEVLRFICCIPIKDEG